MNISVYVYQTSDHHGRTCAVDVRAVVEHSPREGFDHGTMAKLETDLGDFVRSRLWEAMEKGGTK